MSAKKTGSPAKAGDSGQPSFEAAMKRLEALVGEMEGGKLNLEDMIARFEEGQGLIDFCSTKLNEVEKKVEMLVKQGGKVAAQPFTGEEDGAADADDEAAEKTEKDELF